MTDSPKLYVGASTDLRVDFVPQPAEGEASYWVLDARGMSRSGEALRAREGQAGWVLDTRSSPTWPMRAQSGAGSLPPTVSTTTLAVASVAGLAGAKLLGGSWAIALGAAVGVPVAILGLVALIERFSGSGQ